MKTLEIMLPAGVIVQGSDCEVKETETGLLVIIPPALAFEALAEMFGKLSEGAAAFEG